MKKVLVSLAVILAVVVPVAAAASTHRVTAPKPRIIGTWPNDVNIGGAGGYIVWNTGRVQALSHAPYYGSLRLKKPVTDIVGFAADSFSGGYWLIAANGTVYGLGSTCQSQKLVGPKSPPKSKVVGAINTTNGDDGFEMVTSTGRTFSFTCQFVFP